MKNNPTTTFGPINMQSCGTTQPPPSPPRQPPPIRLSTAELIGHDEDVLPQILIHLPFKSLGKFRCVSKQWYSLITHHLPPPRTYPPRGLLFRSPLPQDHFHREYEYRTLETNRIAPLSGLTLVDQLMGMDIVQSTNGLLLLKNYFPSTAKDGEFCVCNPITKQKLMLPRLGKLLYNVCLAYDPLISRANFKVIGMRNRGSNDQPQFEILIYSSETRLWRVSNTRQSIPFTRICMGTAYFRGAVYWVSECLRRGFCFDLDGEQIKEFEVPGDFGNRSDFGESRGRLYGVAENVEEVGDKIRRLWFDVYEMGTDYTQWSLKHRIDGKRFIKNYFGYDRYHLKLLFVVREENEDDSFALLDDHGVMLHYNFKKKTFKELRDRRFVDNAKTHLYSEVLAFL